MSTTIEQFITDHDIRLDTLSGPERVTLNGWDTHRYRLRLTSDYHGFDFNYHLGLGLNAEEVLVAAQVLASLIVEEDYYRSGEAPAAEITTAAKRMGEGLVLLLGGEESYESLVDDAREY